MKFEILTINDDFNNFKDACMKGDLGTVKSIIERDVLVEKIKFYEYEDLKIIASFTSIWDIGLCYACLGNVSSSGASGAKGASNDSKNFIELIWNFINCTNNRKNVNDSRMGNTSVIELMISKGALDFNGGLFHACFGGDIDVAKLMLKKGAYCVNQGLKYACLGKHMNIVELMASRGATEFDHALGGACEGGNLEIVNFIISKNIRYWESGLVGASNSGRTDLIELIISKANSLSRVLDFTFYYACFHGQLNIVEFIISKAESSNYVLDLEYGFYNACEGECGNYCVSGSRGGHGGGNERIVELIMSKIDSIDWNRGLHYACIGGNMNLIRLMISKGANDWNVGLHGVFIGARKVLENEVDEFKIKHVEAAELMISKGANDFEDSFDYEFIGELHCLLVSTIVRVHSKRIQMLKSVMNDDIIRHIIFKI